jgi:uncharacterized repeat protein (TIGR01451 family)
VPACPASADDALMATTEHCEVQASPFQPGTAVPAQSPETAYHVRLRLDESQVPGSNQAYNNHLPIDPILNGVVTIAKTTPMVDVTRGQMIPYTIRFTNTWPIDLVGAQVVDRYPPGFRYIEGSARLDGVPLEPELAGGELVWSNLTLATGSEHTIELLLAPGAGVIEGKHVNRALVRYDALGVALSGEATATVRIVPEPTFDCTDVTGKVFNDGNLNGVQDEGETGLGGARVVSPTGIAAVSDQHGRFHITCAAVPREGRGSNIVLKLDDRSLPSGFRSSTDAIVVQRATRGKALHVTFGAAIHRVVGLDIADAVFEPDSTEMRPQWRPRIDLLVEELTKGPSLLRLSYLADMEDETLVRARVRAITGLVEAAWAEADCCYRLNIEHEVFWRTGRPAERQDRLSRLMGSVEEQP